MIILLYADDIGVVAKYEAMIDKLVLDFELTKFLEIQPNDTTWQ
jgi:hypothetical protein